MDVASLPSKASRDVWSASRLRTHWNERARSLKPFTSSPTTQLYFRDERRLFADHFGDLAGKSLLKLDLWNDIHNTRILEWAAGQGARVAALDISDHVIRGAIASFERAGLSHRFVLADARAIPFPDDSFDHVYTMGTIEHFDRWDLAIDEIRRVLRPGGTAVVGVPNKLDPFLRPLTVGFFGLFGLYPYAPEKSFTMGGLVRAVRAAGLEVEATDGILFYPGLMRIADVVLHQISPVLSRLMAPTVWPFEFLTRRIPLLRKAGYLICCRARKPA